MVELDKLQSTQHGVCALYDGYLRLQTHTLRIINTYYFSTTIMVARARPNITLYASDLTVGGV